MFGAGCAGGGAAPELHPVGLSRPWIGDTFSVRLDHAGTALGALALGLSSTTWNGAPLPRSLGPGMPGCDLLVSPVAVLFLTLTQGSEQYPLSIPPARAFVGSDLHYQGFALAPTANATGVVVSAGGRATVGSR